MSTITNLKGRPCTLSNTLGSTCPTTFAVMNRLITCQIKPNFRLSETEPKMVQRRAARWVLSRLNGKDSVTEMLSALKWKTLESRRTIARLSMLYKMRNRLVFYEDIKLQPVDPLYSTRSKEYAYKQPIAIRNYYKYSFYSRTISE